MQECQTLHMAPERNVHNKMKKLDLSKTKILIFLLLTGLRRQAFAGSVIAHICIYILDIGKITTIDKGKK